RTQHLDDDDRAALDLDAARVAGLVDPRQLVTDPAAGRWAERAFVCHAASLRGPGRRPQPRAVVGRARAVVPVRTPRDRRRARARYEVRASPPRPRRARAPEQAPRSQQDDGRTW